MSNYTAVIDEIKLDWLTVTCAIGSDVKKVVAVAKGIIASEVDLGAKMSEWSWKGYEGQATKWVRWGERADGVIIQLIGESAHYYWKVVSALLVKARRVDCAVDFRLSEEDSQYFAKSVYEHSNSWKTVSRERTYFQNTAGGETVYFGGRKGERLLRVYNRTARSGKSDGKKVTWRAEYELKGNRAESFFRRLVDTPDPDHLIESEVRTAVLQYGLPLSLESGRILMDATVVARRLYDGERTLAWLEMSVRPAIMRLVREGHLEEVEKRLGFPLLVFEP